MPTRARPAPVGRTGSGTGRVAGPAHPHDARTGRRRAAAAGRHRPRYRGGEVVHVQPVPGPGGRRDDRPGERRVPARPPDRRARRGLHRAVQPDARVLPFCDEAELLSHEVVQIAMLHGTEAVYLARHEGRAPMRLTASIGSRFPAAPTAVGNALLTTLTDTEIADRFSGPQHFPQLTERSVRTRARHCWPRSAPRGSAATPSTTTRSIPASSAWRWCCRRGRAGTSRWPSAPR